MSLRYSADFRRSRLVFRTLIAAVLTGCVFQENPVKGRKADVVLAAYWGAEAAVRALKDGAKGQDVADTVLNVTEEFKCKPVENMLFYAMTQNKLVDVKSFECSVNPTVPGSNPPPVFFLSNP